MNKTHQKIIDDSTFLTMMVTEQDMDFFKLIENDKLLLLEKLYADDFNFTSSELEILINVLHFLGSNKKIEILIFLHYDDDKYLYLPNFADDIIQDYNSIFFHENLSLTLLNGGFLNSLKILYSNDLLEKPEYLFYEACTNGFLEISKWLYTLIDIDIHENEEEIFMNTLRNKHLHVVEWLYKLGGIDVEINEGEIFYELCDLNYLKEIKWLYNLHVIDIYRVRADNQQIIYHTCISGDLELSQWLYNLGGFNLHTNNEELFREICANSQLDVAKWIYEIGEYNQEMINIYFQVASEHDNLNFIQWLFEINDNFLPEHIIGYAFENACENECLNIIPWIYSLGINNHLLNCEFETASFNKRNAVSKILYDLSESIINFSEALENQNLDIDTDISDDED